MRLFCILLLAAALQDKPEPAQVHIKLAWIETSDDVWNDLREVDPAFKAVGAEVEKLAKGLEAEDIETRAKASKSIRDLGLSAYGAIKGVRDKAATESVRAEFDAVLKSLAGDAKGLPQVPAARRIGAREGAALHKIQEDKMRISQEPSVALLEGSTGTSFVGDEVMADAGGVIKIESGERSVRAEKILVKQERGFRMSVTVKKIDRDKRRAAFEITATDLGPCEEVRANPQSATLHPDLASGEYYLAGPFPSSVEKGTPWWILVDVTVIAK